MSAGRLDETLSLPHQQEFGTNALWGAEPQGQQGCETPVPSTLQQLTPRLESAVDLDISVPQGTLT